MNITATITQHVADIYADDHTEGMAVFEGILDDFMPATDLGVHEGTAQVTWYSRPDREPQLVFIGRWTDVDGVNHGRQESIDFEVTVVDFGPFRAVLTQS